jgi:hypothetical protein
MSIGVYPFCPSLGYVPSLSFSPTLFPLMFRRLFLEDQYGRLQCTQE